MIKNTDLKELEKESTFQVYLEDRLYNKDQEDKSTITQNLNWTGSKTTSTELIYSLHSLGVFNNGNTDLIAIVRYFEDCFNINLGDFYHTFLEILHQ